MWPGSSDLFLRNKEDELSLPRCYKRGLGLSSLLSGSWALSAMLRAAYEKADLKKDTMYLMAANGDVMPPNRNQGGLGSGHSSRQTQEGLQPGHNFGLKSCEIVELL